ncbi:Xaa-Pro aminopeptidase [Serratia grimesii]|uniref:Xaa-Pro aminopeptidase n=1 Tax=Serratia grimesii TaxID=82995 RepID=A0ABR4U6G8_9GAMM|nr:Xaa-Pro aminopeptidase [Serratia grimesii]
MLVPPKPLSHTERDRRWQLARDIIQTENLAALIVYGDREAAAPAGFAPDCYFTNDRPGSIIVFIGDEPPRVYTFASLMVADHIQASLRGDLQWIDAEQLFVGKTGRDVGAWLANRRLDGTRIGIIGLEPYPPFYGDGAMPARTLQGLADALPAASWVPVYREFFQRASVKSEEELALVRYAAHIGEAMSETLRATAQPGVSEADLVAAVTATCFSMGGYTAELLLGSGPEYVGWGPPAWQYRAQAPRVLQEGDLVLSEIFALYGMMETQHQAAVAIGEVHPEILRASEVARASYEAGLQTLRTGNTFGDVVDAMEQPLLASGGWHVHPLIHSINPYGPVGFGAAPGIESLPEAARYAQLKRLPTVGRDVPLQVGMCFAFEPNCAFGRHMANIGGTVLVGESGGVALNENSTRLMLAGS